MEGPNLVTNGDFISDIVGWNNLAGNFSTFEWDAGKLSCIQTVAAKFSAAYTDTNIAVTKGHTYTISFDFEYVSGDSVIFRIKDSSLLADRKIIGTYGTTQTVTVEWKPTTTESVVFQGNNSSGTDICAFKLDNVSITDKDGGRKTGLRNRYAGGYRNRR